MSIIRQRHKNLLIAGSIGFVIAITLLILVYLILIRGNPSAMNFMLKDSHLKITEQKAEEVKKTKVYTLLDKLEKGAVIEREMLMAIEVENRLIPVDCLTNIEDLIGKTLMLDLSPRTLLTENMISSVNGDKTAGEIVEIELERIPEIIQVGDLVNLRIHFPTGQNYCLLKKKEIIHMNTSLQVVFMELTPDDILAYSSAQEDCARYSGAKLVMTKIAGDESNPVSTYENQYPLNPNVLSMNFSLDDWEERVRIRQALDDSLQYLFEQNSSPYNYTHFDEEVRLRESLENLKEDELRNVEEGYEIDEETLGDEGDVSDEVMIQADNQGRDTSFTTNGSNENGAAHSENDLGSVDEASQVEETGNDESTTDQPDFDF